MALSFSRASSNPCTAASLHRRPPLPPGSGPDLSLPTPPLFSPQLAPSPTHLTFSSLIPSGRKKTTTTMTT
jgi:hypothetical protein